MLSRRHLSGHPGNAFRSRRGYVAGITLEVIALILRSPV